MDILRGMLRQNPWWRSADSINTDEKVVEWGNSLRYEPRLMHKIEYFFPDSRAVVYTLRGPRQVGKTTLVKLQIKKFLDMHVHPLRILYYTMDLAREYQDVVDVIDVYMEEISRRVPEGRRYLFLDEISSVPDWQRGIKWLVDTGSLHDCTVLATGSHSIDLKGAAERLPGRKGETGGAHDKILLPMKFAEYASVLNSDIRRIADKVLLALDDRRAALHGLTHGHIDERLEQLMPYLDVLNRLLHDYMVTGGLPRVVNGYINSGHLQDPDYGRYADVLAGEWTRLGKDVPRLKTFGRRLATSLGSPVSWAGLAKGSAMGSPNTAQDYADTLERLFAAYVTYKYDMDNRCPLDGKNKKIYFSDPFFLHVFRTMTGPHGIESCIEYLARPKNAGAVLEGVVANHLVRLAFLLTAKKFAFDPHYHVFYWRDSKSREVDFVLDGGTMRMPIEVKSGSHIDAADLGGMTRFVHATGSTGVVLSGDRMRERRDYLILPASVFLMLV